MNKRIKITVFGKVQGVFFRYFAKEEAGKLNIRGFARNMTDGNMEIIAEGEKENLNKLIEWVKTGPNLAEVEKIEVSDETSSEELSGFIIK